MTAHESDDTNPVSMDTELGRLLVEHHLATQTEVDECLSIQVRLREENNQKTLAEILVERGVVTQGQLSRTRSKIEEAQTDRQIPGYKISSKLGSGAMATVFKAKQLSLDRMVAIKVLPRRLSDNAEYVERFYREGKAAAKLNHPNIVQAFDVGEAGGWHYFVMEYVEGHTLYDELVTGKVFCEPEALQIIIQIARALEHAHSMGLIHRDVKPKNIMITKDGTAKLADMGLAREASDVALAKAEAGRAFGTPYYISPEQIRGEIDIDFRTDIYSLGATLYHLVTGRVPFEAPKPAAVMHKHLKDPLIPPDHINTKLSSGVGELVEVMMAKNRKHRYASTTDLLVDLEAVAAGEPPPQARMQIDADVLSQLTGTGEGISLEEEPETPPDQTQKAGNLLVYLILLAGALLASAILNVVLLLVREW